MNNRSSYPKRTLHTRVFLVCASVLMIALLLTSIFISIPTMKLLNEDYIQTAQRDMALVSNMTKSTLLHLYDYAITIATDNRIIQAAYRHPNGLSTQAGDIQLRATLSANILSMFSINNEIYKYDILTVKGKPFNIAQYALFENLECDLTDEFFANAAHSLGVQIHGPFYLRQAHEIPVFIITKSIVNLDTHEPYGILVLMVKEFRFSRLFSSGMPVSNVSYYIVDDDQNIISCTETDMLGSDYSRCFEFTGENIAQLRSEYRCILTRNGESTLFMLSDSVDRHVDWRILMATSMSKAQQTRIRTFSSVLLILIITCLILLFVSYKLSQTVTRPINNLAKSILASTENGTIQRVSDPGGSDEIKVLYTSYNKLVEHIDELIRHVNQEQEAKHNYKFQLIQSQVKPHFLYNMLMTLKSLVDLGMNDTASECIDAMSSFYRLTLNNGNDILTIQDEIELCTQYMFIQRLRYVDMFDYVIDIPSTLNLYCIPKMSLQPILENAIYHGIKEKARKGTISVSGCEYSDHLELTVSDNGVGMSSSMLEQLRAAINSNGEEAQPRHESFGLYSVNRRIRMLYGESYGLRIDSREGEYTVVSLIVPKKMISGTESGAEK